MIRKISHFRWSAAVLAVVLALGVSPGLFNLIVDPYRMHGLFDLGLAKKKIATQKHGPLYKIIEYPRLQSGYLLFGDSRSRALRDKLFHELGFSEYYNFAYSGGTMAETIDSFWYAVEHAEVKGIAIGVPLRSMDKHFSRGKNQVPEAIALRDRPLRYYTNMFVADTGMSILEKQYPEHMSDLRGFVDGLMRLIPLAPGAANAQDNLVKKNYCEAVCDSVSGDLWNSQGLGSGRRIVRGHNLDKLLEDIVQPNANALADFVTDAGPVSLLSKPPAQKSVVVALPPPPPATPDVDEAWLRRIEKGGRNDWKNFTYSEEYYQGLKEISEYAKQHDIALVFFIPPAHADMQAQASKWKRGGLNLEHRRRMAKLGVVYDYDVPTEQTLDRANFTDPYHFKANVARAMTMDLIAYFGASDKTLARIKKRRKNTTKVAKIQCPTGSKDPIARILPGRDLVLMGRGCVLWGGT
ncbi:MAG: hypothetical protein JKY27_09055 [Magnetovibrio sp.]|nr:hypothetical protein [Magnetovibrio sp.]